MSNFDMKAFCFGLKICVKLYFWVLLFISMITRFSENSIPGMACYYFLVAMFIGLFFYLPIKQIEWLEKDYGYIEIK